MGRASDCDLLVLGGGAAGLAAARAARRRGASVVMVTAGPPGGDCTFTGCVPSKALLSADTSSFPDAMGRVRDLIAQIAEEEDEKALSGEGIVVRRGRAVVRGDASVEVDGRVLRGAKLVLATGTSPRIPDLPGVAEVPVLTNENLFALTTLPRHLVVLGGGPIGCEMAEAFRRFSTKVTLVEAADRLLGKDEPTAAEVVLAALSHAGVDVRLGTAVTAVAPHRGGISLETSGGPIRGSHLLVATGRTPVWEGLEQLGLRTTDRGFVAVDERMRTSIKGVYAAGDVTGGPAFTHAADEMGRVATANALGRWPVRFRAERVPWVTFTSPEVARIGMSEAQAAVQVKGARVVELPMTEVDRARTSGQTAGFVKIVVGPHPVVRNQLGGKVLGATIVAERAGEMLAELVLAVRTGMITGRLAQTSHAYPTWSLAVQQAVGQLFGVGERRPRPAQRDA